MATKLKLQLYGTNSVITRSFGGKPVFLEICVNLKLHDLLKINYKNCFLDL